MRILLLPAFAALSACGGVEAPADRDANQVGAQAAQEEPVAQAIDRLEREWTAAHVRKDLGWYDRHVAPDYRTIVGGRAVSRAEVVEHVRSSPPGQRVTVEAVEVRPYGDAAVATVTQSYTTADGKSGRSRITDVWVKSPQGAWTVVHSHEGPAAP